MNSKPLTILLLLNIFAICIEAKCQKNSTIDLKTYIIDLDLPPRERFKQVVIDFQDHIWDWFAAEKKAINPVIFKVFEELAAKIDTVHHFPHSINEEFHGIAEALVKYNATYGDVVIFNLIYDFTAFCTSIVAQQKNGKIIHGRNFDYYYPQYLEKIAYIGKFVRNGTVVFTSAQLAGFVGVITGHKHNAFTFSINERDQGEWYLNVLTVLLDKNSTPLSFLTRQLMENITNYHDAVNYLSKTDVVAPAYFIVGGMNPEEGAVITRAQFETVDFWHLNSSSSGIESWYLLETNYDHWLPAPANDDRRDPGMKLMNMTTQANINYDTLYDVLTSDPVCNNETAYTVVMSAKDDDTRGFRVVIR